MCDSPIANDAPTPADGKSRRALFAQLLRYVLVGGSSAAFELAAFQALYALAGVGIAASNIIALVASTTLNFTLNRSVTFKSAANPMRSLVLYLALFAFNTTFSTLGITKLVDLGVHSAIAKLMTMACIVMWNFVLYKKVIFK